MKYIVKIRHKIKLTKVGFANIIVNGVFYIIRSVDTGKAKTGKNNYVSAISQMYDYFGNHLRLKTRFVVK